MNPHNTFPLAAAVADLVEALEEEHAVAIDLGADPEHIRSEAEFDKLKEVEELTEVFDGLGEAVLIANSEEKQMKELAAVYTKKAKMASNRAARIKGHIGQLLEYAGLLAPDGTGKHKGKLSVSVQRNGGVEPLKTRELDDDELELLKEWNPDLVITSHKLDTYTVRELLKEGVAFPVHDVATIEPRGTSVRVR
jgi:hypothetical protein